MLFSSPSSRSAYWFLFIFNLTVKMGINYVTIYPLTVSFEMVKKSFTQLQKLHSGNNNKIEIKYCPFLFMFMHLYMTGSSCSTCRNSDFDGVETLGQLHAPLPRSLSSELSRYLTKSVCGPLKEFVHHLECILR